MNFFVYLIVFFFSLNVNADEINLYTTRHYDSDIKLYKDFTKQTGINVNIISGKAKPLEKRILEEGKSCKGDLFFLADAGRLYSSQKNGVFKKISSKVLEKKIPAQFRSDYWFGITKRARIIFYNPKKISSEDLVNLSYEDLTDKRFNKYIAIRQSNNVYNQSLIASLIENHGLEYTRSWTKKFVTNFSRQPKGNDRAQILSVASGESKLAIANTYYYGLMLSGKKGKEQKEAAKKVRPFFPNQQNRGTHMNISGIGVLKHSPNPGNAIKFIEFLLTHAAQEHMVNNTFEYPMIESVDPPSLITKMGGNFKQDNITNVSSYGKWQTDAFKIMQEAGWN